VSLWCMRATEVRCDIPVKELKVAVRGEKNSKVCRRLLGIIHLLEGGSRQEAQSIACLSVNVMRKWIKRFNQDGIEGLRSIKQTGRPPRMSWEVKQALRAKVLEGPGEEGLARYRLIDMKQYLKEELGVDTSVTRIWNTCQELGLTWKTGRQRHPRTDEATQQSFKKTSKRSNSKFR
jgi:transposase